MTAEPGKVTEVRLVATGSKSAADQYGQATYGWAGTAGNSSSVLAAADGTALRTNLHPDPDMEGASTTGGFIQNAGGLFVMGWLVVNVLVIVFVVADLGWLWLIPALLLEQFLFYMSAYWLFGLDPP